MAPLRAIVFLIRIPAWILCVLFILIVGIVKGLYYVIAGSGVKGLKPAQVQLLEMAPGMAAWGWHKRNEIVFGDRSVRGLEKLHNARDMGGLPG